MKRGLAGVVESPATVLTDLILAGFGGYWAATLIAAGAARGEAGVATVIWGVGFAATALAAASGGVVHGFQRRMGRRYSRPLWRATLHLITLGSAAMLSAAVLVFPATQIRLIGLGVVLVKLVTASVLLARRPKFGVALADHAVALAAVLSLQLAAAVDHGAASAPWIIAGIAVAVLAGAIQALRLAPHPRFDHNDLYHVVQLAALWLLYRGGLLLVAA